MSRTYEPLERLGAPPIEEVVCGVVFPTVAGLDTIAAGSYWHERTVEFPKKEVQPPIVPAQRGGVIKLRRATVQRAWLVSASEDFLVQIQEDRFYLNWRRRETAYPRFGDHDGSRGVLSRMLEELERFSEFCARTLQCRPIPTQAHLAKIDHLVEGQHWSGLDDLVAAIPALGVLTQFAETPAPGLAFRFEETREDSSELSVQMDTALRATPGQTDATRIFKIEENASRPVLPGRPLREVFVSMNAELNDVFGRLLPRTARQRLFSSPEPNR